MVQQIPEKSMSAQEAGPHRGIASQLSSNELITPLSLTTSQA